MRPVPIAGLLVTATDTGVGKTVVAGAIAQWLSRQGRRVAVSKPLASGCVHRREGLVSEDAEFLAHCADARHPLDLICPVRFAEPLAPAVASERAREPVDWESVQRSLDLMCRGSDAIVVEGVGGVLVPLDTRYTMADLAAWLGLPAVVVARPGLGTINHTLLTLEALRSRGVRVAGVVINRYPPDKASVAEETNPRVIEKWGKTTVLAVVPDEPLQVTHGIPPLPRGIQSAIGAVDWLRLVNRGGCRD